MGENFSKYVLTYIIDSFLLAYLLTIQGPCKHGCHGCLAPVTFETLLGATLESLEVKIDLSHVSFE